MSPRPSPRPGSPRLRRVRRGDRIELWTQATGDPPSVYGERWIDFEGHPYRSFEPTRSKIAAAVVRDWEGPLPRPAERWLYLGAASGSTASHVADLVGPQGAVYAVEKSVRPFARLYRLSERWPNLWPVLADARAPQEYFDLVPAVDGLYADVSQPDQIEILVRNAALYLKGQGNPVLLSLKTPSLARGRSPAALRSRAEEALHPFVDPIESVRLEPFHRGHYLLGGPVRSALFRDDRARPFM
jgi:fibrillarin-like rRNA methylase